MNQDAARAFILALNNIQPYVPPLLFNQLVSNPICGSIQTAANDQQGQTPPENVTPIRKPGD